MQLVRPLAQINETWSPKVHLFRWNRRESQIVKGVHKSEWKVYRQPRTTAVRLTVTSELN